MPMKVNYFNIENRCWCNTLFSIKTHGLFILGSTLGYLLKMFFPPNDIHPRLKYLFEKAFCEFIDSGVELEKLLRDLQGSMEARLKLKEILVRDTHYDRVGFALPGTYFWVIRHFLGLLPIPLLPKYANKMKFDWENLSKKCKYCLQNHKSKQAICDVLDVYIAESLNFLSFEHFLMLNILIVFIRKVSQKSNEPKLDRKSLLAVTEYYCGAVFRRPYRPGLNRKDEKHFPLLLYIAVRWRGIQKICGRIGHPAFFLESNSLNYATYKGFSVRDKCCQTLQFTPEAVTAPRNAPDFCPSKNDLRDVECQTSQVNVLDKSIQSGNFDSFSMPNEDVPQGDPNAHSSLLVGARNQISEENNVTNFAEISFATARGASILTDWSDKEILLKPPLKVGAGIEDGVTDTESFVSENKENEPTCDAGISFLSTIDDSKQEQWKNVVEETEETVRKVDEYIYDDYETFHKEDYNQISNSNKVKRSVLNRISKMGWTYISPQNSARDEENLADSSYYKYPDIFDEDIMDGSGKRAQENLRVTGNVMFKSCNNSDASLWSSPREDKCRKLDDNVGRSKINFNLKRFKKSLNFLRVLTPKKVPYSICPERNSESNVKYKKINFFRSNTL